MVHLPRPLALASLLLLLVAAPALAARPAARDERVATPKDTLLELQAKSKWVGQVGRVCACKWGKWVSKRVQAHACMPARFSLWHWVLFVGGSRGALACRYPMPRHRAGARTNHWEAHVIRGMHPGVHARALGAGAQAQGGNAIRSELLLALGTPRSKLPSVCRVRAKAPAAWTVLAVAG